MPILPKFKINLHYPICYPHNKILLPDSCIVLHLFHLFLLLYLPAEFTFLIAFAASTKKSPSSPDFKDFSQDTHFIYALAASSPISVL